MVCETDRSEVAQDFVKSRKALVQGLTSKHLEFVVFALELILSNRLDLGGTLMVCVEGHPDVVGGRQVRYAVKLATTQTLDDDVPCLSRNEFDQISHLSSAYDIWGTLDAYHEGTTQIKTIRQDQYKREYNKFEMLAGESLDE